MLKVRQICQLAVQSGDEASNGHLLCENVTISLCRGLFIFRILQNVILWSTDCQNIVIIMTIARQRFGKHVPVAKNNQRKTE
jgi:hypothetical protein